MESGNSGSVQSSSGGDEEAESMSMSSFLGPRTALLPPHASSRLPTTSSARPQLIPFPPHPSSFLDPLSSYLDAFTRSPPPPANGSDALLNLDRMPWAGGLLRALADSDCTDLGGGLLRSAPPARDSSAAAPGRGLCAAVDPSSPSSSTQLHHHPPAAPPPQPAAAPPPRNSRKRSRASRRAPTTVLTTDTSNFRAMVQEFTGIPSPPFPSAEQQLYQPRSRLDLFHSSGRTSAVRPPCALGGAASHPLLRPFAQKVPAVPSFGPFAPSSSSSSSAAAAAATAATATAAAPTAASTNIADGSMAEAFNTLSGIPTSMANTQHQPPPPNSLGDRHERLLNMFNFQSSRSIPTTRYEFRRSAAPPGASGQLMAPSTVDYAIGGAGLQPPAGGGADDLLQWAADGSGGSEGRG